MSRSVLDFVSTRVGAGPVRDIVQRIGAVAQWGRRFRWETLARNVQLERPDLRLWLREDAMRMAMAFIVSYVLVVTVGMMVLRGTARNFKPNAPASGPIVPSRDALPGLPSLVVPHVADPSKSTLTRDASPDNRPADLDAPPRAVLDLKARAVSKSSTGLGRTTAGAARPGGGVRGGAARVTGITLWGTSHKPWVSITASAPVRYELRNVEPDWVVVDVSRAQLALPSGKPPAGRGLVRQIRAGQFTEDVVRVIVELRESVPIHIATSPDKTAIIVSLAAEAHGNGHVPPKSGQHRAAAESTNFNQRGNRLRTNSLARSYPQTNCRS